MSGSISTPCYLWHSLEECRGAVIIFKICCVCFTRNLYLYTFIKEAGMLCCMACVITYLSIMETAYVKRWLPCLLQSVCSQYGGNILPSNANEAWLCLNLIDTLCQVAERGHTSSVRELIESPIKQYPDTLLIGFAHSRVFLFLHFVQSSLFFIDLQGISFYIDYIVLTFCFLIADWI